MPFVNVNGLNLLYERSGMGAPMLFIGGTGWDMRQHPNPLDSPLAQQFDLVLYDQRGMGQSDKPDGPYSMQQFAGDAEALMTAFDWDQAHVIGYSFGGMVAQELAIQWPERVASLVLAASTPGGEGGSSHPIEEFVGLEPMERARLGLEVADMRFTREWQAAHPEEAASMISKRMKRQTEFIDETGAWDALISQLKARAEHDAYDRLDQITAPTLILAGTHDGQAPGAAQERMTSRIENSQLKLVSGSHNFIFEADEAYNAISEFCFH